MKAIRLHDRGGPEQLFFEDAPTPEVRAGDVLVRVCATGITPTELTWDETYQHADGTPRIPSIPGHEVSGVVERVAPDNDDFRPGDEVYGLADFPRNGAAAEFVAVRAINLARKPQSIAHTQAASLRFRPSPPGRHFSSMAISSPARACLFTAEPEAWDRSQYSWRTGETSESSRPHPRGMWRSCGAWVPTR
jgi:Alcohol dehydrogenase GroES-like domain